jgi:hypothetical protein
VHELKHHSDRLVKLFKVMMSANAAGEVVNARGGIVRILQGEKKDIHDFATVLLNGFDPKKQEIVFYKPPSLDEPPRDIAAWCLFQFEKGYCALNDRELDFVRDMTRRWGPASERQIKWLASIHNRILRELKANGHAY